MNELSLFSGAGGGLLGTKLLGWRSVGYVENNTYCQKILAQRIEDGFLDEAPIFGDIRQFIKSGAVKKYQGFVEVVTAGFPCQPFSVAGKKKGKDDERNLWPETLAVIRAVRPRYALLENVPGLLNSGYFPEILSSLAEAGFDARWTVLGADDVGAPHRRKRLWILAHSNAGRIQPEEEVRTRRNTFDDGSPYVADSKSEQNQLRKRRNMDQASKGGKGVNSTISLGSEDVAYTISDSKGAAHGNAERVGGCEGKDIGEGRPLGSDFGDSGEDVADSDSPGLQQGDEAMAGGSPEQPDGGSIQPGQDVSHSNDPRLQGRGCLTERGTGWEGSGNEHWWPTEPDVGRVAHGVAHRVDMLKALGNGQVPRVFATAWRILNDADGAVIKKTPR